MPRKRPQRNPCGMGIRAGWAGWAGIKSVRIFRSNGDGRSPHMELPSDVTADQFLEAVQEGVRAAIVEVFSRADIEEAVRRGVEDSMPFADLILNAITDGVKEAHRD